MVLESDQGKKCYVSCYETSCMQFLKNKYFRYLYRKAGLIGPIGAVQTSQETTVFFIPWDGLCPHWSQQDHDHRTIFINTDFQTIWNVKGNYMALYIKTSLCYVLVLCFWGINIYKNCRCVKAAKLVQTGKSIWSGCSFAPLIVLRLSQYFCINIMNPGFRDLLFL